MFRFLSIILGILVSMPTFLSAAEPGGASVSASTLVIVGSRTVVQSVADSTCGTALARAHSLSIDLARLTTEAQSMCGVCISSRGYVNVPWFCESADLDPEFADQRFTAPYIAIDYAQGPVPQIENITQGRTHYVCTDPIPSDLERHRVCLKDGRIYRPDQGV